VQASEEAWAEQKVRVSAELAAAKKPLTMFGKMIGDLAQQVVTGTGRVERAEDSEVLKVHEYYSTAAVHMADVRRQGERLVKRQGGALLAPLSLTVEGLFCVGDSVCTQRATHSSIPLRVLAPPAKGRGN